jgi:hypothetical protein
MLRKNRSMKDAFDAIRKEREYQDKLWGDAQSRGIHSVSEWILFIQNYLREAEEIVCRMASPKCDEDALHIIRKIGTMAVCCMEQNGIADRDMKDLDKSCELHGVKCDE